MFPERWVWELDIACLPYKFQKQKYSPNTEQNQVEKHRFAHLGNKTKFQTKENPIPAYCRADAAEIFGREDTKALYYYLTWI